MGQTALSLKSDERIDHPVCERCGVPMWLVRIVPTSPTEEKRMFNCAVCESDQIVLIDRGELVS
jgi:hypothetical protein